MVTDTADVSDEDKIAMSGKPRLGAITKIEVIIKESDEFKVSYLQFSIINNVVLIEIYKLYTQQEKNYNE